MLSGGDGLDAVELRAGVAAVLGWRGVGEDALWKRVRLGDGHPGDRVEEVVFVDRKQGWCLVGERNVYATEDGGARWAFRYAAPEGTHLSNLAFSNQREGWAMGTREGRPIALRTLDGGGSWESVIDGLPNGAGGLTRVWANGERVVATGQVRFDGNDEAVILGLSDGERWEMRYRGGKRHGALWDLRFVESAGGWAVGPGIVLVSADGGASWKARLTDTDDIGLGSVTAIGLASVWVAGGWNKLMRSEDGGMTWRVVPKKHFPTELFFTQVAFVDARTGWVAGDRGSAYRTADGGASWRLERIGGNGVVRRLWVQGRRMWAATDEGLFSCEEEER